MIGSGRETDFWGCLLPVKFGSRLSGSNIKGILLAENTRSAKINEGPFSLVFSLTEKVAQCRLMIDTRSIIEKPGSFID